MSEKKKKGRRAYLESIKKNDEGTYEYTGAWYVYQGEKSGLRLEVLKLWGICAVLAAALIVAGSIDAPGSRNSMFVLLPYVIELMGGISMVWAMCRLTAGGNRMREYVYQASAEKLPGRALFTAVFGVLSLVGEIIYICQNGFEKKIIGFLIFLILEILIFAMSLLMRLFITKMEWTKIGS